MALRLLACGLLAVAHGASAPSFATLFHGGAVLQRDAEASVWGTVQGGGAVTLYLDGSRAAKATVEASGKWTATLPKRPASFGSVLTAVGSAGNSSVKVNFGDVLFCSGQSNMAMPVANKPGAFQADNGTAEAAAANRYTGGIWLWNQPQSRFHVPTAWTAASSTSLSRSFSAVCWYTGKSHFERLGGSVPVGLFAVAVGGSPIEYWLSKESLAKCETDVPRCDTQLPDSSFYDDQITSLLPYTIGAIIWDQAERDLKCNHVAKYPCMQRELVRSWRQAFRSPAAPFLAVQLPDYYDPMDPGAGRVPGFATSAEGLLAMRLAQESGLDGVEKAALVATYDQSCNNLAFPDHCPFGSVHNIHKQVIGMRVAAQLAHLMRGEDVVVEGPRAQTATAAAVGNGTGFSVTIRFAGGSAPFALQPTRNCTDCCHGSFGAKAKGDFDASPDGTSWAMGSYARMQGKDSVVFHVGGSKPPAFVRYTGGSNFTQCAVYNKEALPALPFQIRVQKSIEVRNELSTILV